jgi:hypothetical protein
MTSYDQFLQRATGGDNLPYDYQYRLACGEQDAKTRAEWLTKGTECNSN